LHHPIKKRPDDDNMGALPSNAKVGHLMHNANGTMQRGFAILNDKKLDLYESPKEPPLILDLTQYKDIERTACDDATSSIKIVPKHHGKQSVTFTTINDEVDGWFERISGAMHGRKVKAAKSDDAAEEELKDGADIQRRVDEFETAVINNEKDLEIKKLKEQIRLKEIENARLAAETKREQEEANRVEAMRKEIERATEKWKAEQEREEEKKSELGETKGKGKEEVDDDMLKMQQKVFEDNKRLKMGSNYTAPSRSPRTPTKTRTAAPTIKRRERPSTAPQQSRTEPVCPVVPPSRELGQRQRRGARRSRSSRKQDEAEQLRASLQAADDLHACWEFNAWNGCNKGRDCLWSHQWLVNEAVHPWTGEKLPGIVERYLIDPDCMENTESFHNNGRNNEYQGEWDRNRDDRPRWQRDRARW